MRQGQDPTVVLKDGIFHLVQSDGCNIRLRASRSLAGLAATTSSSNPAIFSPGCNEIWAPELHFISNRWFIYYTMNTNSASGGRARRGFVAESTGTNVTGPYIDRGCVFRDYWNIDGNVFRWNNQVYYLFSGEPVVGSQNIYIARMQNPYTLATSPVEISRPTRSWETVGSPNVNEGAWGFERGGNLYIVYSASGCWTDNYTLGLLTLTPGGDPLDPTAWTKTGPVFSQMPGAYGPGHNSLVEDDAGQWWNVFHANINPGEGCKNLRRIRAQRVFWRNNGTPDFGSPVPDGSVVNEDPSFLSARFYLYETSGTTAYSPVCGLSATLKGGATWANPGLRFNGSSSYLDAGPAIGNDVQHQVTLSAWIHPNSFSDWAGIICKGTNVSPYAMQLWNDGSLRFTANWGSPAGGSGGGSWNSATKLTPGRWHHVAVTYDSERVRFYVNGTFDSNQPEATLRFGVAFEPLVIGADFPGGDEFFNGVIRDARVYGRAANIEELITAPVMTELSVGDDSLGFTVNGEPGASYAVLASTNMINWSVLYTTNAPTSSFQISIPIVGGSGHRFHKIQMQ
jgi:GH43 family beta-xylosidase